MTDAVSFAARKKWSDSVRFSGSRNDLEIRDIADGGGRYRGVRRIRSSFAAVTKPKD